MAEASPGVRARPLSPYVTIWRWHITMAASILHRVAGVGLYLGALILAGWTLALASGSAAYGDYMSVLASIPGRVVLFALTVAIFFHLANGIRHLAWDIGKGFALRTADATAWIALIFAVLAAAGVWIGAVMMGGR